MRVEKRGSGRPIVYLPAAGGVRWTPFLERLAEKHTVHVPAFAGFDGAPAEPGLDSPRGLALAVADYIASAIGNPCDVLGASFGGAVALWLALERAQWVDHLVLECPHGTELLDKLARVQAPTLILHGTADRIISAESMRLLKSRLERAFLVYVWDAGHHIEVDQPERMAAVVESFLERSAAFVVPYA